MDVIESTERELDPKEQVYFYPGRLTNHSYKAYRITHMFMTGNPNEADSFIDNLLVRICQETHPKDITIHLATDKESVWTRACNTEFDRYVPQFSYVIDNCFASDVERFIENIVDKILYRTEHKIHNTQWRSKLYLIYVSSGTYEMIKDKIESYNEVLFRNFVSVYTGIIVYADGEFDVGNINGIPLRVCCTSAGENVSKSVLGSSIASAGTEGSFFLKYSTDMNVNFMYINRFPKTFIYKFIKFYGVKRDEQSGQISERPPESDA